MAEPIEIIIRKGSGGEGTGFGIPGMEQKDTEKQDTESPTFKLAKRSIIAIGSFALSTAKKAYNYGISQYGNITGNYIGQAEMEMQMELFNNASSVVMAGLLGAKAGSIVPGIGTIVGAVVGSGIAVANIGVNNYFKNQTLQTNIDKINTYANIMQERSGNMYNNGSRGTYQ